MPEIPSDKPDDAYLSTRGGLEPEVGCLDKPQH